MTAARPAAALQWRGLLMLLAYCLVSSVAGPAAEGHRQPQGYGIGDYEYLYDELPREHLARFGRDSEHVQHVPANAPRPREDPESAVQRVPPRLPRLASPLPATALQEDAAPEAAAAEAPAPSSPPEPTSPTANPSELSGEPEPHSEPAAELQPPPRVESAAQGVQAWQAPQVPAALPDDAKSVKEDMQTANFFWGLGPVYPHLYVYRRVPHLVPLHGWNPYHSYLITHPV